MQDSDLNLRSAGLTRLAEYLDACCRQHKTVTYLEAANAIDTQPPHRIHRLTVMLEDLLEHDQKYQQPLRAALVVSRSGARIPGQGFFLKAQALGVMKAQTNEDFHQQCLSRLFDQ